MKQVWAKRALAKQRLESTVVEHPVPDGQKRCPACKGTADRPLDDQVSVDYDDVPERFRKRVRRRKTLACACGEHVVTAHELAPLAARVLERVAARELVWADETPHRMQGAKGKMVYVWTFLDDQLVAYVFSESRSGEVPKKVLGASTGRLVVDAYTGYNPVLTPERRQRAGCLAHARRKFFDALPTAPEWASLTKPRLPPYQSGLARALSLALWGRARNDWRRRCLRTAAKSNCRSESAKTTRFGPRHAFA